MDAAACRRLQHRMESHGRAASCQTSCNICGFHCSCPPHVQHEGHRGDDVFRGCCGAGDGHLNRGASFLLPSTAQAWLLQLVEGAEVDITDGGTDHRRRISCCCSCCHGYHHLFHTRNGGTAGVPLKPREREKVERGEVLMETCTRRTCSPERTSTTLPTATSAAHPYPDVTANGVGETTVAGSAHGAQQDLPFKPSKSSLTLAPLIRLAESTPSRAPAAGDNRSAERGGYGQARPGILPHEYGGPSEGSIEVRQPACAFTHTSFLPVPRSSDQSAPPQSLRSVELSVPVSAPPQPPSSTGPAMAGTDKDAPKTTIDAVAAAQHTHAYGIAPVVPTGNLSLGSLPVLTELAPVPRPDSSQRVGSSLSGTVPLPPRQVSFLESSVVPQSPVPHLLATPVLQPTVQDTPVRTAASQMASVTGPEAPALTPVTTSNVQPTPAVVSPEPTSTDVINALREKLLLEKADAYVRGLERQQEERLAQEDERQRSKNYAHVLELFARLCQEDRELLEAMYESSMHPVEASPPSPAFVGQSPSSPQEGMGTTTPSQPKSPPLPEEVMAAYKVGAGNMVPSVSQPQPTVPTQVELPPPLPPPPVVVTAPPTPQISAATALPTPQSRHVPPEAPPLISTAVPWGAADGTMKAWVDQHFGSSLDPQHRALLQHVLLSREAEIRRVAAAESQCKKLEAQRVDATNSGVPLGAEECARTNLNQWQQEHNIELTRAHDQLHAREEELIALRKAQEEQKAKLDELTRSMQSHSVLLGGVSAGEETDELRRWKMRCDAVEQQHRFSVQRLEELQAYIEQLRNGAQKAVMNVASSGATAQPVPSDTTTVPLSSVNASPPQSYSETVTPYESVSFGKPPTVPSYSAPPYMAGGAFAAASTRRESPVTGALNSPQPRSDAVSPSTASMERAAALKQLREEMDVECSRFAHETQRWQEYVKHQEERWLQLRRQ
ncbi:hypothetical protein TraAM80_04798 [Trypanosoma rangeli]|uniref:Uncharacterized protein n=1 Tax=Trypanosoma rangeli TaxID=5698 RepID=A0A422NHV8_TRYRA|nr:uncharacterized protein TraAM80_04798 [Trypanosoma rangeli]RNF05029.1 hypothetical protein TraAM80_04798 [Trypanosoma rangeli]|eukprot:RNF05029.1 hypothetical protein TraAM80_04798 [Trypanosoma rangeli]